MTPHPSTMSPVPILVPLARIRMPRCIQACVRRNPQTVKEYAEAMQRGVKFPPVVLFQEDNRFRLADGWHRVAAAKICGLTEIESIVHQGEAKDALRYAVGANTEHGLGQTNADKRRVVTLLIERSPVA